MDESGLRDMLERAMREEPPMGQLARTALRTGIRLRRRRRAQSAATAAVAAVAVIGIVPALTTHGNSATSTQGMAYVAAFPDQVVPVNLTTGTAGQSVHVPEINLDLQSTPMAIAPNGRVLYVTGATGLVTPIDTTTNKAGQNIDLHSGPLSGITVAPNGKTAYVIAATGVIPVDLASRRARGLIRTPYATRVVVAPNGKFAYVLGQQDVIPIRVATSAGLRPIPVSWDSGIVFSPDGSTAYALSEHDKQRLGELIPINTTTNAVGKPIYLGFQAHNVVGVPHSGQAYVEADNGSVVPVNLITRAVGRPIEADAFLTGLTVAPDGKALYLFSIHAVRAGVVWQLTEISTARNRVVRNISIRGLTVVLFAISPDGRTGFVATAAGTASNPTWRLVPIHLADNKVGRPVPLGHLEPVEMVFAR
jgi:DNA-binding beta-propeller fold protein YncE